MTGLTELAAAARARNDAALERRCARVVGPLKRRIAELEGLLAESEARASTAESQVKALKAQAAKAAPSNRKGR